MITFFTLSIFWLFHTFLYKSIFSEKLKTSLKAYFTYYCRIFAVNVLLKTDEFLYKARTKLHVKIT